MKKLFDLDFLIKSALFLVSLTLRTVWGNHLFMAFATVIISYKIVFQAIRNLRYRIIGVDLLVSIAVVGAILIGEYWEAVAVAYLFYFGSFLERVALSKTRDNIQSLIESVPEEVTLLRNDLEVSTSLSNVVIGDIVVVKPGYMIPVDGIVHSGYASVNQSSITGESVAVDKEEDALVYAGSMVESGYLKIEVLKNPEDSVYSGIIELIENAQDEKTETQKLMDRFASVYTPLVVLLSIVSFLITRDIKIALSLLVVSCPGALVIATPISIVSGIGAAAKRNIIVKSGQVLETLAKVDLFVFDKTGTLTEGKPEVVEVIEVSKTRAEILRIAAIGEQYSEHPIAQAITKLSASFDASASEYDMITGKGLRFTLNQERISLGNASLFEHLSIPETDPLSIRVIVGNESEIFGIILLKDALRNDARKVLDQLKNPKIMLTGDHEGVAKDIASKTNLTEYYADCFPEDKFDIIKALQKNNTVAMVGDGINDAPALAFADVGIAIGGAQNNLAMETADIILMASNITDLPYVKELSEKTIFIMKTNLVIAMATALILIMGVLGSFVSLSLGMFVHEVSVLIVIFNALRILNWKG